MPQFTLKDRSNPEAAIKNAANHLQTIIGRVAKATDANQKAELAMSAWQEYNLTMRSLKTVYNTQTNDPKIEAQLSVYRSLGQEATKLAEDNLTPERKKQLNDINGAIAKRIAQAKLAASRKEGVAVAVPVAASVAPVAASVAPAAAPVAPAAAPVAPAAAPVAPAAAPVSARAAVAVLNSNQENDRKFRAQLKELYRIITQFDKKVRDIRDNKAYSHETKQVAMNLVIALYDAQAALRYSGNNNAFLASCKVAIETAKPTLTDIGWTETLKNLLKSLANVIVKAITFGNSNGFFQLKKSDYAQPIADVETALLPADAAPQATV